MINYFSASKFFLYAAIACVLIVSAATLFPFIVGKYVFFRTAVALALIAFLIGWGIKEQPVDFKPLKSPLFIAVSVFVFIFALAGFFGINPTYSFWSNFERGEGVFQLLNLYVFFALLVILLKSESDWKKFLNFAVGVAFLVIVYGLFASWGVPGFIGEKISLAGRFYGSLGNPAYTAPYLIFALFYSLYLLISGSDSKRKKYFFGASAAIFLVFSLLGQTRGAFIGLAAGVLVFALHFIFSIKGKWRAIGVAILAALVLAGGSLVYFQNSAFVQKIPGNRLFKFSLSERTAQNRLWTWGSAIKAFKEKPILGWGPENFSAAFDKYFDTRHFTPGDRTVETWFDRAHSVFLGYLTDAGILGLLSYLGIFVAYYYLFFKSKKSPPPSYQLQVTSYKLVVERGLFFALPIAYLFQGILLFDVLPIYINLFISLALANWYFNNKYAVSSKNQPVK